MGNFITHRSKKRKTFPSAFKTGRGFFEIEDKIILLQRFFDNSIFAWYSVFLISRFAF